MGDLMQNKTIQRSHGILLRYCKYEHNERTEIEKINWSTISMAFNAAL